MGTLFGNRRHPPDQARREMVTHQLVARGITDKLVLDAFAQVPREEFVPENARKQAYEDRPLSIGRGQTISQPYMVAIMTQELRLRGRERVLEIGTGSGYQTAILARIVQWVHTVERIPQLAASAAEHFRALGIDNVTQALGDGTAGWPGPLTFDRIIVTAASPEIPPPLIDQLEDGGILMVPVGRDYRQMLVRVEKAGGRVTEHDVLACVFVPLIGDYGHKAH